MRAAGVEEIGLFYLGESFMVPRLENAVGFAKNSAKFPYVFLTTNGSLAKPSRVEACMESGLDSLKFSLNYADKQQFCEIARVNERLYDRMLDNIKSAWEIRENGGYDTGLYASYIMYDGEQGEKMAEAVEEIRPYVDEVYALPLYNQADLVGNEDWEFTAGNRGRYDALRDPLPCWAVFTEGHITWDGKLSACCFDHDGRFHMGDLTNTPFMEAWNSKEFQELRKHHLDKKIAGTACEGCVAYA
jgi:radical SAM protein with 4Fe4S-binding SPASM domain